MTAERAGVPAVCPPARLKQETPLDRLRRPCHRRTVNAGWVFCQRARIIVLHDGRQRAQAQWAAAPARPRRHVVSILLRRTPHPLSRRVLEDNRTWRAREENNTELRRRDGNDAVHVSSILPAISNLRSMPATVTTTLVGNVVPVRCLFALASRTAFSIFRWAVTRSSLKNLRTLVPRAS
jgi:hypothetical protein